MIAWIAILYGHALTLLTLGVLVWVFRHTRLPAALAYATYIVLGKVLGWPLGYYMRAIDSGEKGQWLGATAGERLSSFTLLSSAVGQTIHLILFLWLVLSLVRWSRRGGVPI